MTIFLEDATLPNNVTRKAQVFRSSKSKNNFKRKTINYSNSVNNNNKEEVKKEREILKKYIQKKRNSSRDNKENNFF